MAATSVIEDSAPDHMAPAVQALALVFGIGFIVVGILGFLSVTTTHHGALAWNQTSRTVLFDHFRVSRTVLVGNIAFGAIAVLAAMRAMSARAILALGGLLSVAVFVYGHVVIDYHTVNYLALNRADDWAYLGIGIAMLGAAWLSSLPARHRTFSRVIVRDLHDSHYGAV
ncbi:MAG TPA: DUF4383 domain-containing protein [Acidimicrobiia bacterium]|nr:DUF4383 domain-containing protein [Acidimicrobiia bacterium]